MRQELPKTKESSVESTRFTAGKGSLGNNYYATVARWVCPRRGGARRGGNVTIRRRWAAARAGARGRRRRVRGGARLLRRDAVQKHGGPQGRVLVRHDRRRRRIAGRGRVRAGPAEPSAAARTRLAGDARALRRSRRLPAAAPPPTSASTRRGRTTPLALLAEAVAARDAASPRGEYNRRAPAAAARRRALPRSSSAPGAPGRARLLAVALDTRAGARGGARPGRCGPQPVVARSRARLISAQVLARGAGRGLRRRHQRPAHHAANLTARSLWAAGALPGLARSRVARRRLGASSRSSLRGALRAGRAAGRGPGAAPARRPGRRRGWDEVALLKHGEVPGRARAGRAGIDGRPDRVCHRRARAGRGAVRETLAVRAGAFFNAKFSIPQPGTASPHCGPSNARPRAHVTVAAAAGASLPSARPKRVEWGPRRPSSHHRSADVIHEGADPRIVLASTRGTRAASSGGAGSTAG